MKLFSSSSIARIAISALFLNSAHSAVIRNYAPVKHNRYTAESFPTTPVESGTFWKASYDWSGVGWRKPFVVDPMSDPNPNLGHASMGVTMISDIHFVGATNFNPGVYDDRGTLDPSDDRGVVQFLGSDGIVYDHQVSSIQALTTNYTDMGMPASSPADFFVGTLSATVDTSVITSYKLLTASSFADFIGVEVLQYGQRGDVGVNTIDSLTLALIAGRVSATYRSLFPVDDMDPKATPDDLRFVGGDSGSPSFYEKDGELILAGVHGAIGSMIVDGNRENYDNLAYFYQSQVISELAADGRTAQFEFVVPVPEPSSLLLSACTSIFLFRRRKAS